MAGVFGGAQHISYFGLLGVERESVREAGFRIIVLERELVEFVAAIGCTRLDAFTQGIHFLLGHRREILRDIEVLFQHFEAVDTGNGSSNSGKAHGVAERLFRCYDAVLDSVAVAAERLHAENRDTTPSELGKNLAFEAAGERGVKRVKRHLDGVEGKSGFKHAKMNVGILMAGKSDETDFAILLGFVERFGSASLFG